MKRVQSIRAQLTLLATGVLALLLVFGTSSYLWLRERLHTELEAFAQHETQELANVVAAASTAHQVETVRVALDRLLPEAEVLSLSIWDLEGRLVYQNPTGDSPFSKPWPEGFAAALAGGELFETLQPTPGVSAVRTARLVRFGSEPRWVAVAWVARDRVDATLTSFRRFGLLGFALTTVLMLAGRRIIVTRALGPVQQLVRDAEIVLREGPGRRLAAPPEGSELGELAALLNRMLARTEDSLERLRRFTAHASHELRTPLTRMRGELESALASDRQEVLRESLGSTLEDVESLRGIIDGLLELARGDERLPPSSTPTDLSALVEELADQARLVGLERRVQVEFEAPPRIEVPGNRALLARAIWNLMDNALRFSPVGGHIRIRLSRSDARHVRLELEDEGPGLGPAPERLFEAFARGERQPEGSPAGFGLGLALSRSIARRHGGDLVALAAGQQRGARLRLELPVDPPVPAQSVGDAARPQAPEAA